MSHSQRIVLSHILCRHGLYNSIDDASGSQAGNCSLTKPSPRSPSPIAPDYNAPQRSSLQRQPVYLVPIEIKTRQTYYSFRCRKWCYVLYIEYFCEAFTLLYLKQMKNSLVCFAYLFKIVPLYSLFILRHRPIFTESDVLRRIL